VKYFTLLLLQQVCSGSSLIGCAPIRCELRSRNLYSTSVHA